MVKIAQTVSALVYDPSLYLGERLGMAARRKSLLSAASGTVLEIGAGTGLNLPYYTSDVTDLTLSEPDLAMSARLKTKIARLGLPWPKPRLIQAAAEGLPLASESIDTVVSTLCLCSVRDLESAVAEVRRVLRPEGQLLFIEHVRSDSLLWGRLQDRVAHIWAVVASGCRCNRKTLEHLSEQGFLPQNVLRTAWRGMPPWARPLVVGRAIKTESSS